LRIGGYQSPILGSKRDVVSTSQHVPPGQTVRYAFDAEDSDILAHIQSHNEIASRARDSSPIATRKRNHEDGESVYSWSDSEHILEVS
jgi:hypothetical protein